jgi:hypothetical protein
MCVGSQPFGQRYGRLGLLTGASQGDIAGRGWSPANFILWPSLSLRVHRLGSLHALRRGADGNGHALSPRPGLPVDSFPATSYRDRLPLKLSRVGIAVGK